MDTKDTAQRSRNQKSACHAAIVASGGHTNARKHEEDTLAVTLSALDGLLRASLA
jgi:hypothetical protein